MPNCTAGSFLKRNWKISDPLSVVSMTVIPLGTASAVPTRTRHLSGTVLIHGGAVLLFDCGEGVQLRMLQAGISHTKVDAIFITHLHGDHYFGMLGLLSTMAMLRRETPLTIVSPSELESILEQFPGTRTEDLPFSIRHVGLQEDFSRGIVYESDDFVVEARSVDHRVFAVGYRFVEKSKPGNLDAESARALGVTDVLHYRVLRRGHDVVLPDGSVIASSAVVIPPPDPRMFAYITDTRPCRSAVDLARSATLVYHEATFGDALQKQANETGHSTAREAAEVARKAGAGRLILGHFSARYQDVSGLVEEARSVFPATEAAVELERYELRAAP